MINFDVLLFRCNSTRGPLINNILLDVLVCSIAVYFYESCSILASPKGKSKLK